MSASAGGQAVLHKLTLAAVAEKALRVEALRSERVTWRVANMMTERVGPKVYSRSMRWSGAFQCASCKVVELREYLRRRLASANRSSCLFGPAASPDWCGVDTFGY